MRVHFVNENVGGHVTMHRHVKDALTRHADVEATFWDVPRDVLAARLVGARWPGLARLDLDLHLVRARLAQSELVRRHLAHLDPAPDVLHLYTQNTGWLSTGTMRRVPTVVSIDASNSQNAYLLPHRRPTRFTPLTVAAGRPWERRVFDAARAIVAHSRWAADAVIASGVPADRMHIVPFGIRVGDEAVSTRDGGLPRIAFVGMSMERKGGWRLLDLWRRTLRDASRLVLVTPEHVPPTEGLEVHNDVRQADGRLEQVLSSCDLLVMPGDVDTFGYAILEAMAASLPVVVPRLAAIPEVVDDGVTGLLVPPGDDYALTAALKRLVTDDGERKAMGAAARQRVLERFDSRITTDALVEILRDVAA
jgi:glycosyltransferase involved in cell wall biosynthesis